jgi:O-antigen ligase
MFYRLVSFLNSKEKIFFLIGDAIALINAISIPLLTYSEFNTVALCLQIVFYIYLAFLFIIYKKSIPVSSVIVFLALWIITLGISFGFNGFIQGYFTIISSSVLFLSFYLYTSISKYPRKIVAMFFVGFAFAAIIFLIRYLLQFGFSTIGRRVFDDYFGAINSFAPIYTIGSILAAYYIFYGKKKWFLFLFYIFAFIIFTIAGFLTGSRQYLVGILVPCSFLIAYYYGKKKWYFSLLIFVILFLSVFLFAQIPVFKTTFERLLDFFSIFSEEVSSQTDYSSINRLFMINEAIYLFSTKPLFGYGANGVTFFGSFATYSHNTFSELLCNFGIMGFLFYELMLFIPVLYVYMSKLEKKDKAILYIVCLFAVTQQMFSVLYLQKILMVIVGIASGYASSFLKDVGSFTKLVGKWIMKPQRVILEI